MFTYSPFFIFLNKKLKNVKKLKLKNKKGEYINNIFVNIEGFSIKKRLYIYIYTFQI